MPTGAPMPDGYATYITFANYPNVKFWEKEVTPFGLETTGKIDTTTMRNTAMRTSQAKALHSVTAIQATVAYDPACYTDVIAMLGENQVITVTEPDGTEISAWGFLDSFKPGSNKEGEMPTAVIMIEPSNQNDSGVEQTLSVA